MRRYRARYRRNSESFSRRGWTLIVLQNSRKNTNWHAARCVKTWQKYETHAVRTKMLLFSCVSREVSSQSAQKHWTRVTLLKIYLSHRTSLSVACVWESLKYGSGECLDDIFGFSAFHWKSQMCTRRSPETHFQTPIKWQHREFIVWWRF